MKKSILLAPLGLLVLAVAVCGGVGDQASAPMTETARQARAQEPEPSDEDVTPTPAPLAAIPAQEEPSQPADTVELAPGDYGLAEAGGAFALNLTATRVECAAPNLLVLETLEDTFYFWTVVLPGFSCEQARHNLVMPVVGPERVDDPTAVSGKRVGIRVMRLTVSTPAGDYQVAVNWPEASTTFLAFKAWHAPR